MAALAVTEIPTAQAAATAAVEAALEVLELTPESPAPGSYLVRLEGQRKLATMTWLIVGAHSLHVEAFFCRRPDVRGAFRRGRARGCLPDRTAAAGVSLHRGDRQGARLRAQLL